MAYIYGDYNNNALYGNYYQYDYLYGYAGDDYLAGSYTPDYYGDYMEGGYGNDVYVVDSYYDTVYEYAGQGTDSLYSYVNIYGLNEHVENLYLYDSPYAYYGIGNNHDNQIYGNNYDNYLHGGTGHDYAYGNKGNDYVYGGDGDDYIIGGGYQYDSNEYDYLWGDAGKDTYVLGDNTYGSYYQGQGYAIIKDFKYEHGDLIDVYGSKSDYTLYSSHNGSYIYKGNDIIAYAENVYLTGAALS